MVAGKYIELQNEGRPSALIVSYSKQESAVIIDSLRFGRESYASGQPILTVIRRRARSSD